METIERIITTYGLSVVGGIAILIVGWLVAGFVASLVKYLILAFTVVAVLNQFGVQTASMIAVLGAAGLAIGLALQGTLSHLAAGVMIMIFRPFRQGHYIEVAGSAGTVKTLTLFTTELATPDNIQIIVPNGKVWGDVVKNYSFHATRRVDFSLGIGYGDDIDKAIKTVLSVIGKEKRAHKEPEPLIVVGALADSSVNLTIRVWCDSGDYWGVKFDLTKAFKEALDKASISIPFPQRDVHLHQVAAE